MAVERLEFEFDKEDKGLVKYVETLEKRFERLQGEQKRLDKDFSRGKIGVDAYEKEMLQLDSTVAKEIRNVRKLGVEVKNLDKAFKVGKGSGVGNASIAIQELGRGISDFNAVGGFSSQGLQRGLLASTNNLERFAEIMRYTVKQSGGLRGAISAIGKSLLGGGGIILGVTVLLSFLPKIIAAFQRWKKGITETEEELDKFRKKMNETSKNAESQLLDKLNAAIEEVFEDKQDAIKTFNHLIAKGFRGSKVTEQLNKISEMDDKLSKLYGERDDLKNYIKLLREAGDLQTEINDVLTGNADERGVLSSVLGGERGDFSDTFDTGISDVIDPNDVEIIDEFASSVEDLNAILEENGRITAKLSVENTQKWLDAQDAFEKSRTTVNSFANDMVSAFESAAGRSGDFFTNLATGILSAIGSLLVKEGAAYITLGIARNAALPGSGSGVIKSGAALVAAGAGLKAVGTAARSGGGGGGSKGTAASTPAALASADPSFGKGKVTGSRRIGETTTRGDQIRYNQQVANDNYKAYS